MPRFKLTIAYDGTGFVGWQRQTNGPSIQALLEDALAVLEGAPVTVIGAGRTDAGVHALGQVAGVTLGREIDAATLLRAVNAHLPETIRVIAAEAAPDEFHAQFRARAKTYRYQLWNDGVLHPFAHGYVWHLPPPRLDLDAMREAAAFLLGRQDFASFEALPAVASTTERDISVSRLTTGAEEIRPGVPAGHGLITYEIRGDGFLRHMVRSIAGTLVEVGRGRRRPEWIAEVLAAKSRAAAGPTAPAAGLFLVRVEY